MILQETALIFWVAVSSWYYGYHISELNFPQPSLTCHKDASGRSTLPACLDITSTRYSIITAVLTVGGLLGSLAAAKVIGRYGMYGTVWLTGAINLVGSIVMTISTHWIGLVLGRFVSGLSVGLAITTVAPLLSHIATTSPSAFLSSKRGLIGTLNQLGIVLGILSAQLVGLGATGMKGDKQGGWRWVVAVSGVVAVVQFGLGILLQPHIKRRSKKDSNERLGGTGEHGEDAEAEPLLSPSGRKDVVRPSTISEILANPSIRPQVLLVAFILAAQQFSGINAVLFYSTPVLKPIIPDQAGLIGIGIAVLNALMTFPPMFLVDRIGRIPILLTSLGGMILSSILLAHGLNTHNQTLSAVPLLLFVASFAIGLGPIPFLLVSELVPPEAVPATSSIALSSSWVASFVVALGFLPLRDALGWVRRGVREGEGRVFWVFLGFQVGTAAVVIWKLYKR
ncbi:general substrate transporter [Filobasidium floriforme]|uniref:general substrate transporter n=1 Tax=Filobasidium floriforme TaxID=5210 RepID=UPI001E8DE0FC|nr:general substrate transporter [Filobasidium floriforme]KAH8087986.1 general substrate transporter [Filobasidium floriforme]